MEGGISDVLAVALATFTTLAVLAVASVRRRYVQNDPSMSAVVGLSIDMGFACGAGLLLLNAAMYLGCVEAMRRDWLFVQVRWLGVFSSSCYLKKLNSKPYSTNSR